MKRRKNYSSILEVRLARERYRYETKLHMERLENTGDLIIAGISLTLSNLSLDIRRKLFNYSVFRFLIKTGMFYNLAKNFQGMLKHSREEQETIN
jgi:hypothetical protein